MKTVVFLLTVLLLAGCTEGQHLESRDGFAVVPRPAKGEALATFAGGCFWAMQECMVELKGVHKVISGYAGGSKVRPSYEEVLTGTTGHAESVLVFYDPKVISFEKLTAAFFSSHDPRQVDRQGPDVGTDYRSIVFYRSKKEREVVEKLIYVLDSVNGYHIPVATEVTAFKDFYPAETDHQDYYKRNPWDFYIRNVSAPKVRKLRKAMPDWIKPEYLSENYQ
jgi:peptide-methionine (S)-S-oxide reductase